MKMSNYPKHSDQAYHNSLKEPFKYLVQKCGPFIFHFKDAIFCNLGTIMVDIHVISLYKSDITRISILVIKCNTLSQSA